MTKDNKQDTYKINEHKVTTSNNKYDNYYYYYFLIY